MTPTTEAWLPVVGYEGSYEVSNHGRVRSLDRTVDTRQGHRIRIRGRILKSQPNREGRRSVSLCVNGRSQPRTVYSLALEAFVGPRPLGMEGCHNDGDCTNDHLSNLRWDTHQANCEDTYRHGHHPRAGKAECPYGHHLGGLNAKDREGTPGPRCLACRRTYSNAKYARKKGLPPVDHKTRSDSHYAQIMAVGRHAAGLRPGPEV